MRFPVSILLLGVLEVCALDAAALDLRFTPQNQIICPGEAGNLSVMLDEVLDARTIELRIAYDPEILQSQDGGPGRLFDETGCFVWWGFEEDIPGAWHGFAVVMDAYCWISGPGELFYWDFISLQEGYSRISVEEVILYDVNGDPMEGVGLHDTWVFVSEGGTSVPEDEVDAESWSIVKGLY